MIYIWMFFLQRLSDRTPRLVSGAGLSTIWSRIAFCPRTSRCLKQVPVGSLPRVPSRPLIFRDLPPIQPMGYTIPVTKFAETTTLDAATVTHVQESTSAPVAEEPSLSFAVAGVRQIRLSTHSLLHRDAWARHLAFHPDRAFSFRLMRYLDEGVPILYEGPDYERVCPNWRSVETFRDAVQKTIVEDVALGRKSGPFPYPPLPNFVSSPLGAFAKKRTGKVRVIHDLSWPPDCSVNSHIDPVLCSVAYISIDNAVSALKLRGTGALMSKVDLRDAYKNIVVRPEDWHHLGSS